MQKGDKVLITHELLAKLHVVWGEGEILSMGNNGEAEVKIVLFIDYEDIKVIP